MQPLAGEWSYSEIGEMFKVSRKTAEKYIVRYGLEKCTVIRNNKEVQGARLSDDLIGVILEDRKTAGILQEAFLNSGAIPSGTIPEGDMGVPEGVIEIYRAQMEEFQSLLEEYRNDKASLGDLVAQQRQELERLQGELLKQSQVDSDKRVNIAHLEAECKSLQEKNSELVRYSESLKEAYERQIGILEARLQDKDKQIEAYQKAMESEKARADAFNNQIRAGNDLVLAQKTADAQFRELLTQIQALQQKAEQDGKPQNKAKGFRFMGFEISKPKG